MKLLPRLPTMRVKQIIADLPDKISEDHIRGFIDGSALSVQWIEWNASGGTRASEADLKELRIAVLETAVEHGFPGSKANKAGFDRACAKILTESPLLRAVHSETFRDDCWSYMATILLLPVTLWRYGVSFSRMRGGIRNTFQRLWIRGVLLDRGCNNPERWLYLERLTEDACVQLTERPGIAASKVLTQAIAHNWVIRSVNGRNMEALMRKVCKKLIVQNELMLFDFLSEDEIVQAVSRTFEVLDQ